ncbi:hypothetical protein VOLCADRAFT_99792 [Volvox carteri f. nagariensis]|uniref:Uncharacterized protein n=1 Tax=Volvox carteri f. nagariensis TaxID=3068 RepID=D8UIN3_VOLCA|nr:uncharacterized protein VOLCADRAFT_99792 [Volvox carteri f. nagariensis]EFJ40424.1 hypothetical protein VOLCADRAFT_99792 [Volvox carteri f. nagariensis]|eukprot:XP_002958504.1 hypothetical protein VOLCADRAFT_99792 [Volvox carteri f. nagariensis]
MVLGSRIQWERELPGGVLLGVELSDSDASLDSAKIIYSPCRCCTIAADSAATAMRTRALSVAVDCFAFGLDIACKNCLWHIEGDRMMWSVGAQMVQYNTQSQEMRFLPLADRGVRALVLAVASNFKYFAVAEKVPGLEYDQIHACTHTELWLCMCIENSKYLLVQYGTPDWTLVVWRWYNGKVLAAHRMESRPILTARFSPVDDLLLAVLTPTSVLQYRMHLDREVFTMLASPPDALEPHFEVAMKRPSVVRFSTGGAMFAYVGRTNAVHIHATYHGQPQLAALKAHASLVLDLRFSVDDRMLISVGVGGAVYFWDLNTFSRVMDLELVDKQALYCSVAVYNSETGAAVVRASDGRMQQIYNGKVQYEVMCKGGQMAPACLLGADKVLLAADDSGGVVSHAWPSDLPPRPGFASVAPPPHTYPIHSFAGGGITRMALVASRGLLFTANGDGTIMMSNIALVLDGVLMESTFGAVHTRGRLAAATAAAANSRMGSAASQRLLNIGAAAAAAAGGGGGGGGVPQGAAAQMGAAAAAAGASSSSTSTSSVPYYITIPEERFLAIRERAIEVAQMVGHAKNDAEYQESGRLHERQVVKELEGAHMSAAEDLEALYEKRLQVEVERVRAMAAARDDARYRGEEEVKRMRLAHERELQELRNHYEAQLAAMDSKMSEAADVRAEQDRFFNEYVKQEDFEDHSQRINKKVSVLTEAAESREQRLKADNNILKRTNLRLKADKTIDMKRMDKLTADNAALREQTEDLKLTIAKLKKELDERDAVNADNYVTIQQLRRKLQELEKHKYVLSYKAETYAQKLEPQLEEIAKLQDSLEGHGRELLNQAKRTQLLNRHVAEKDSALRTAMASLADFKRRCELQDAAITAFAQELYGAMQLPDDRSVHGKSARQKALDDLVRKYCLGDPRANANRNAASEAIAAAAAAETRVVLLQWRLDQETRTQRATQRLTLNQNSQLLRELQVAQQDNRALRDRVDAAFVALREMQHRYAMLERRAGIKSGSRAGDEDLLDGSGGGGGGGGEDVDTPERANAAAASGGGGGGGVASLSGRVPPSRPGTAVAATGRRTPLSAGGGLHRHSHHHPQVRPGTAGGTRTRPPSAGLGPYRSGGPAGGGVSGVARGAPLRAFAELLISERQRMQALAAQLESGAVAVEQQQRALLGLRDQLAAEAAAADGDGDGNTGGDGGGDGGFDGDGNGNGFGNGLVQSGRDSDGGEGDLGIMPSFGRFGASLQGGEGILDGGGGADAAGSTAATGGSASQGDGSSSSRRVTVASNGGGGGGGGGSPIFGGANTASYHAPGVRGLNLAGGGGGGFGSGGGGAPARLRPTSAGGVGLRAFTDEKVDRFLPPPACTQQDLPF